MYWRISLDRSVLSLSDPAPSRQSIGIGNFVQLLLGKKIIQSGPQADVSADLLTGKQRNQARGAESDA